MTIRTENLDHEIELRVELEDEGVDVCIHRGRNWFCLDEFPDVESAETYVEKAMPLLNKLANLGWE